MRARSVVVALPDGLRLGGDGFRAGADQGEARSGPAVMQARR
ncbi:hypothetical protein ACGF3J_36190 [Streptomyces sp. NPDC048171]